MKIQMTGGSPWGFKMTGGRDFRQPLAIGKVTAGGKASRAGVVEGHHILSVNGEDVRNLAHLEAQNKIKAAKTTLVLELSNAPVPKPEVPDSGIPNYTPPPVTSHASASKPQSKQPASTYTSKAYAPSKQPTKYTPSHSKSYSQPAAMTSRSPTGYSSTHAKTSSYEEKEGPPDVEYRPVDSRDSQRRMYEELGDEWQPTAHQSTYQSPSMQALLRSSEQGAAQPSVFNSGNDDKKHLIITSEIKDMILEEETSKQNGHSAGGSLRPTGASIYDNHHRTTSQPASYSTSPTPAYNAPSGYNSQQGSSNNKSQAIGNISKFLQTSGAKQGKPVFAKALQDLQCPIGDPAVLEIRIGNTIPVPTVSWYHNDRPVHESRERDIKFLGRGIVHTLVLGEFTPEFAGRYRCTLTNKHGSTSCSSILSVEQPQTTTVYLQPAVPASNSSYNSSPRTYQPTSNYQQQTKPAVASNSVGLYSKNNVSNTYAAQTGKKAAREEPEESEVMRALREDGSVNDKPTIQSRSMRMLEETLMPESDEL